VTPATPHDHQLARPGSIRARGQLRGAALGIAAATLFGASAPISKRLLPELGPLRMAGLLYLGAGIALSVYGLVRPTSKKMREARLDRRDLRLLVGITVTGGIVGPVLMLAGLARVSGLVGSLLLNLEAPFTILLAVAVFREHLGRRAGLAAAAIVGGGLLLSWRSGELYADPLGVVAIAGGCLAWGIDNNLTQRLSLKDPVAVVLWKTLGAAACTLTLGLALRPTLPGPAVVGAAMLLGSLCYGASILLDMYALRVLGAAREAAYFATAPFVGAALAVPVLGDRFGAGEVGAAILMATGAWLLVREKHAHVHAHQPIEHEHMHVHDEHHRHAHPEPVIEPHAHLHHHEPLEHEHPHVSDLHHRHRH
jgi:drug/metabolite transporter (DMT)-like permease